MATFVAVAESGSFRGAAAHLGYVQSAVSQQIAQLERALDAKLIDRGQGNRGLALTDAGHALLAHARRIVDQVRAVIADIDSLNNDGGGVRVAIDSAAICLLASLTRRLAAAGLGGRLTVCEAPALTHRELVVTGGVDLALGSSAAAPATLSRHIVCLDRWALIVPTDSPLATLDALEGWQLLRGTRLIEDRSHPAPIALERLGAERVISCDTLPVAFDLVRAGAGAALLPALAVDPSDASLHMIELGELLPPRPVAALWHPARRRPDISPIFTIAEHPQPLLSATG